MPHSASRTTTWKTAFLSQQTFLIFSLFTVSLLSTKLLTDCSFRYVINKFLSCLCRSADALLEHSMLDTSCVFQRQKRQHRQASRSLAVCAALEERGPVWQCTAAETPQPSTTGASPAPPMRHADWTQVCVREKERERIRVGFVRCVYFSVGSMSVL